MLQEAETSCRPAVPCRAKFRRFQLKMGFSFRLSSWSSSHVSICQYSDKLDPKLHYLKQLRKPHLLNFKLGRSSRKFQKIEVGTPICCKRNDLIDFEERSSPNEVLRYLNFIIFGSLCLNLLLYLWFILVH